MAVDGVSFHVAPGEVVALIGPNGAGKTTTVETVEGFKRPRRGRVSVGGLDPWAEREAVHSVMGVMLQDGGFWPGARCSEVLRLFASYHTDPVDPEELLDVVGLTHKSSAAVRSLSRGERQRLSLAVALVGRPAALVLDEPTAGVDLAGRDAVRTIVRKQRDDGCAVLLTTHDLEDVEELADRLVVMSHGRVLREGSQDDLRRSGTQSITFSTDPGLDTEELGRLLGAPVEECAPGRYRSVGVGGAEAVRVVADWCIRNGAPLEELHSGHSGLREVLLDLLSHDESTVSHG